MAIDYTAIKQAYIDNADYAAANSETKARAYQTACRQLLIAPEEIYRQNERVRFGSNELIAAELSRVDNWLGAKAIGKSSDRYVDFQGYRD